LQVTGSDINRVLQNEEESYFSPVVNAVLLNLPIKELKQVIVEFLQDVCQLPSGFKYVLKGLEHWQQRSRFEVLLTSMEFEDKTEYLVFTLSSQFGNQLNSA
jgi:hypothetical protein